MSMRRWLWWLPLGSVPEMEASELDRRREEVQVVDVRTTIEFRRGHVPGARSVPIHTLKRRLSSLDLDPGHPVVAICRTAHRSIPAVRILRRNGFEAYQLTRGMVDWWANDLPTETAD
jgi:rhodanese-related sulfurtransferase